MNIARPYSDEQPVYSDFTSKITYKGRTHRRYKVHLPWKLELAAVAPGQLAVKPEEMTTTGPPHTTRL